MGVESDFEISIMELFHELFGIGEEILVPSGPLAVIMRQHGAFTCSPSIRLRTLQADLLDALYQLGRREGTYGLPVHINDSDGKGDTFILESIHQVHIFLIGISVCYQLIPFPHKSFKATEGRTYRT
jgi:hypothetical protein